MNLIGSSTAKEKVFKLPLSLTPCQKKIHDSPARFKMVRAGRKFGKTTFALYQTLKWLGPPNSKVWYLCATYKQAKLIAWQEFKRLIPYEAMKRKPNDTDLTITLKNGSELYLMGTDEMDTLRGPAPTGVIFEEMAQHKREVWHEVIRPNLVPNKAPALFIGTPKGFNWMKDLEDQARLLISQGGDEWAVFHHTIYDNPTLSKDEIDQARRDCDNEAVWRQEYMAEYESDAGRVFSQFSDSRHMGNVLFSKSIPAARSIDWGMRDDTACLWGYVMNKKLYIYREHAENNLPASTQAQIIMGKTTKDERVEKNIIGHDAAKQDNEMRNLTVAWHFQNAGVRPLKTGSKDKKNNRSMLQQLINEDRLLIDRSCLKLRKQLLNYEWKDTTLEKTEDGNDDLVDSLHSMVELYQYDLFNPREMRKEKTYQEMLEEARREKIIQRVRKFPTSEHKDITSLDIEDTVAGYI